MSDNNKPRSSSGTSPILKSKSHHHDDGTRSEPELGRPTIIYNAPVIKTTVNNLNLEYVRPRRAGVILYTVVDGVTLFGLGLDAKTHDLTDFGGGVVYKTDHNAVIGALREFQEETLGIFNNVTPENVSSCPVVYDKQNLIIFVRVDIHPDDICDKFNRYHKQAYYNNPNKEPEVCAITWLTWQDFQISIQVRGNMFHRVQRFLNRADDFSYLL